MNDRITLQDPTRQPHNLPPLRTFANIEELSNAHSLLYYRGYYPEAPNPFPATAVRKEQIAKAIGADRVDADAV